MKYSLLCKARYYLINYLNTTAWDAAPKGMMKNIIETIAELTEEIDNYGEEK